VIGITKSKIHYFKLVEQEALRKARNYSCEVLISAFVNRKRDSVVYQTRYDAIFRLKKYFIGQLPRNWTFILSDLASLVEA